MHWDKILVIICLMTELTEQASPPEIKDRPKPDVLATKIVSGISKSHAENPDVVGIGFESLREAGDDLQKLVENLTENEARDFVTFMASSLRNFDFVNKT